MGASRPGSGSLRRKRESGRQALRGADVGEHEGRQQGRRDREGSRRFPEADAVPWLLLAVKEPAGKGTFARITSVQRAETHGGKPPQAHASLARCGRFPTARSTTSRARSRSTAPLAWRGDAGDATPTPRRPDATTQRHHGTRHPGLRRHLHRIVRDKVVRAAGGAMSVVPRCNPPHIGSCPA